MKAGEIFWDVVPYVTLAIVVVGTWWRYRYDKFGWTTRSSQLSSRGCCGSAARCSTSACWWSFSVTSSGW